VRLQDGHLALQFLLLAGRAFITYESMGVALGTGDDLDKFGLLVLWDAVGAGLWCQCGDDRLKIGRPPRYQARLHVLDEAPRQASIEHREALQDAKQACGQVHHQ
jgi:hypothetical protein